MTMAIMISAKSVPSPATQAITMDIGESILALKLTLVGTPEGGYYKYQALIFFLILLLVTCTKTVEQEQYIITVLDPSWYIGGDVRVRSPAMYLPILTSLPFWILYTEKLASMTSPFWSNIMGPVGPTKLVLNVDGCK